MVPVLVVMSGALAFSAFTGNITTNVNATAGYIGWSENVTGTYSYMHNTNLTNTFTNVSTPSYSEDSTIMNLGVSNLAPGNWIVFNITIKNTGSVGLELSTPSTMVNSSGVTPSDAHIMTSQTTSSSNFSYGSSLAGMGYEYYVTSPSTGSLDHGQSTSFQVFIGLGSGSGNNYQKSTTELNIKITATSDP
ncbi:MAG: hypothetical protein AAE983_04565 [Thermoplasmataceae archaeon]|jgi:hypothetical protein